MKKVLAMLMAALMVAAMFTGCSSSKPATETTAAAAAATAGTVKIGMSGPLTGGASAYGLAVKAGMEVAVEEINAKGGLQIEFNAQDDEADGEKAVSAYNVLKDWGMQVMAGQVTTGSALAVAPESTADNMFNLTPSASAESLALSGANIFQMCFTDPNQGSASAQYIADKSLATKVAVIWKNDDVYSKGVYETFKAACDTLGIEIVSDTTFADGNDTDFSVQIADAQSKGAELVFLPIYYQPASLILAQAAAAGYKPEWFGVDGMDGILTMKGFDTSLAEGVMLLTPFNADSTDERTAAFVKKYQEMYGEVPNQFAADAYDCVYAYAQALEAAGATPDMSAADLCTKMIEQFTSMTFDGLTGNGMTWNEQGQVTKSPKGMVIQNGAYVGLD